MVVVAYLAIVGNCTWCDLILYNTDSRLPLLIVLLNDHHCSLAHDLYLQNHFHDLCLMLFYLGQQELNDPEFSRWLDSMIPKKLYVRSDRYPQVI